MVNKNAIMLGFLELKFKGIKMKSRFSIFTFINNLRYLGRYNIKNVNNSIAYECNKVEEKLDSKIDNLRDEILDQV